MWAWWPMGEAWAYAALTVFGAELAYAFARYRIGTRADREAFHNSIIDYSVAAMVAVLIGLVASNIVAIAQSIARSIGLKAPESLPGDVAEWPGVVESWFWFAFTNYITWRLFLTVLSAVGSISVLGFRLGFLSAASSFLSTYTWPYTAGMEVLIGDLAFAYALTWIVVAFSDYGLIALAQVLIIPRSTRFIGATMLAVYLSSATILAILGIVIPGYVLPNTAWWLSYIPSCLLRLFETGNYTNPWATSTCILTSIGTVLSPATWGLETLRNLAAMQFRLLTWSVLLAVSYALTEGLTYGLASLIDEGVVRVRLRR